MAKQRPAEKWVYVLALRCCQDRYDWRQTHELSMLWSAINTERDGSTKA